MPRYQNANTICTECKRGWQHGVGTTLLTPAEVERALCDCEDIGCIDDAEPSRSKRSVPKPLKRHVLHRDGYRCRVPGCSATANIDVHHIMFLMNGGKNALPNLITLCEGHHLALHEGSLVIEGDANTARFTRVPQNKLKIETRVVECKAALHKLGVAKELIRAAVEATRTHVGRQDLTAQQWIDIALTKIPVERHAMRKHASAASTAKASSNLIEGDPVALAKAALRQSGFKAPIAARAVEVACAHVGANAELAVLIKEALRHCG
jgi:Holliday junction resolvasome RuvABC DNA-binding subunit